jgi:Transposase Tn5 dimerisation domain
VPDMPCMAVLELDEWQALYCATASTPTLRQAVHWIGDLGGFLARRGEGEPGVTVLCKGFSISPISQTWIES